ncbi:hypothetical protein C8R46DRAFT_1229810 [Mycena filopes]|nr:hypothetical protein C8R46DRAFT_1229810 [Mycena filopes]
MGTPKASPPSSPSRPSPWHPNSIQTPNPPPTPSTTCPRQANTLPSVHGCLISTQCPLCPRARAAPHITDMSLSIANDDDNDILLAILAHLPAVELLASKNYSAAFCKRLTLCVTPAPLPWRHFPPPSTSLLPPRPHSVSPTLHQHGASAYPSTCAGRRDGIPRALCPSSLISHPARACDPHYTPSLSLLQFYAQPILVSHPAHTRDPRYTTPVASHTHASLSRIHSSP